MLYSQIVDTYLRELYLLKTSNRYLKIFTFGNCWKSIL